MEETRLSLVGLRDQNAQVAQPAHPPVYLDAIFFLFFNSMSYLYYAG